MCCMYCVCCCAVQGWTDRLVCVVCTVCVGVLYIAGLTGWCVLYVLCVGVLYIAGLTGCCVLYVLCILVCFIRTVCIGVM